MSLILTPPPTVMVFFKEISLKNESTATNVSPYTLRTPSASQMAVATVSHHNQFSNLSAVLAVSSTERFSRNERTLVSLPR